jgi:hypothetical protein
LPDQVYKAAHGLATGKPFQAVSGRPLELRVVERTPNRAGERIECLKFG